MGHFLQPLAEVDAVEQAERIPPWLTNLALDIQAESLLQSLFPSFKLPLAEARRAVKVENLERYAQDAAQASAFVEAASALALHGRFVKPLLPFCGDVLPRGTPEETRALHFLAALDAFRTCPARELPERLRQLIRTFPELRQATLPALPPKLARPAVPAGNPLLDALHREALANTAGLSSDDDAGLQVRTAQPLAPLAEALALARTLRPRFTAQRGGVEVLAPGRFVRRAAARGELPLRMDLPGQAIPAARLVLCLDASGSMSGPGPGTSGRSKWSVAQIAAQAVALAVQAGGGQAAGVVFGDRAWCTPEGDVTPLLLARSQQRSWVGGGTSFRFLADVWRRWPDWRVLVVTDGCGAAPQALLPGDRERTVAVIIPDGDPHMAASWSNRQAVLNDLRHLGAVLALLGGRSKE